MKKKNLLKGLLVSFMLLCSAHIWAYDFEADNIQYTITSFDDMTVEVSGLTDTNVTEVTIPESVEYRERVLTVTSIASEAFQSNATLQSVTISNTITSIGTYAFDGCSSLEKVTIPNAVTSIGSYAFQYCSSLEKATIPNAVTSIGSYAFAYCSSLKSINVPEGIKTIEEDTFRSCSSLTEVTIPDAVTSIGDNSFYNCSSLTEVTIPDAVTSIGDNSFYNCSSLTEVTIGSAVKNIGRYAFYGCSGLTEIVIPNSVKSLGRYALRGCTSVESLKVGNGLDYIMDCVENYRYYSLFWSKGPTQMKSFILADDATSFRVRGYGLTPYNGGYTPKEGYPLFSNIDVGYYYVGRPLIDIDDWSYSSTPYSITIKQPYGTIETLEVGGYCTDVPYFYQSIEKLILGEDVETYTIKNIYQGGLTSITCKSTTPPTLTGTFDNSTYLNVVLYVPIGSKETYQAAEGWRNFWDIIEADVSGIDDIVNSMEVTEVGRYTVSGQKITTPQNGINIVRYSDGTTRKILVQ